MGIHLQEEIIMDILSRLSVQSLLRFKCVSKPWNKLISEPYFTRKHLNHATNNQNSQKFLSCRPYPKDGVVSYYCSSLSSIQLFESVHKLDWPSDFKSWRVSIRCCFDGLSIMGVRNYPDLDIIFLLWNPFTRESIILPNPEFPTKGNFVCGMGYDSTTNDYKVLMIDVDRNDDRNVSIELLSLKKGSWSKIDEYSGGIICYLLNGRSCLPFVHGSFHWLILSRNYSMISFSISNEVYGEIPLPKGMKTNRGKVDVSVLEGMLCIFSTTFQRWGTFKLWLMKEYGVETSWTELITLQDTGIYLAIPKYRFTNGEVLLCCINKKCRVVFMTSKGRVGLWPQLSMADNGFVSTESLISPKLLI